MNLLAPCLAGDYRKKMQNEGSIKLLDKSNSKSIKIGTWKREKANLKIRGQEQAEYEVKLIDVTFPSKIDGELKALIISGLIIEA